MSERSLESWQGALRWRFGVGAARILPRAVTMPETGCVGRGNSVDVPCLPDEKAMIWFGHVDRALAQLPETYRVALALFHGDPGEVASNGGLHPSRRWRAVAPITHAAMAQAAEWVTRVDHTPEGPTSLLDVGVQQMLHLRDIREKAGRPVEEHEPPAIVSPAWTKPLTTSAETPDADDPAERRPVRELRSGPASWRWVQWVFDPKAKPKPHDSDRKALERVEREAKALIGAAQDAFQLVYKPKKGEM